MRKTIVFLFAVIVATSCGNKSQKSNEEIKVDSVAIFRQNAITGLERYIKQHISADPDYGRILEFSDTTLNDSVFTGYMRVAVKNPFGAVQQMDGFLFMVCKENNSMRLGLWESWASFLGEYMVTRRMEGKDIQGNDMPTYKYVTEHGVDLK